MLNIFDPQRLLYMTPAVVIGLSFHEFAHAAAAYRLGDSTARRAGRLTVNPAAHVDILGLIMLYVAGFGWAKPVPVNPYNFRGNKNTGMILVSLAGPLANLALALISAILLGALFWRVSYLNTIMYYLININIILAVFNLIPLPPLDGSKILAGIFPGSRETIYKLEQYGSIILILLLFTNIIPRVLNIFIVPLMTIMNWLIQAVNGLV